MPEFETTTFEWTYNDGDIDTHGTVIGTEDGDCAERVMKVLRATHSGSVSREHLTIDY